jgi:putative tryptophan/tyrosine transport system substrate-binding protein
MRRREFIAGISSVAAWPAIGRAQQGLPAVGFLNGGSAWEYASPAAGFRQGLGEAGYADGRNVVVEYRWADGHYERLPTLTADLISRPVAVIVANSPAVAAARAATTTIPIVFATTADPVELGWVASLNRPGGNLTGVSNQGVELGPKRLQILHELIPAANGIALLVNPTGPNAESQVRALEAAARIIGIKLHVLRASSESDLNAAFENLAALRASGLIIGTDPFFTSRMEQLSTLALRHAVAAIYASAASVRYGGLMSYSADIRDQFRQAGLYAGRILKGEKPADLPVVQPTEFTLAINLKTAKALGLTIPEALLATADEVIQ